MTTKPSSDAFDPAHNGRLLTYNDEERGKTAIAKCLARIQRLNEQSLFLMKRFRPAEDIVTFEPNTPWRRAEQIAHTLLEQAKPVLTSEAIPAQKAGRFLKAAAAAEQAARLITAAETPVAIVTDIYRADREITNLRNWATFGEPAPATSFLRSKTAGVKPWGAGVEQTLDECDRLMASAKHAFHLSDWAGAKKEIDRIWALSREIRPRLREAAQEKAAAGRNRKYGRLVGGINDLDDFPEDRFGWLNARALMDNNPANWPFMVAPSSHAYLELTGWWDFRLDPDNVGEKENWPALEKEQGWREPARREPTRIFVPKPWERQGCRQDNLRSPADAPYRAPISGDKPYNGFAWYRKNLFIPSYWAGKPVVLRMGKVGNWYRPFINGKALGEGTRASEGRRLQPDEQISIPGEMIEYGRRNLFVIQVYNHNNFGGMIGGRPALYVDGEQPRFIETPGPMSYAYEYKYPAGQPGAREAVQVSFLASAMSPAVVAACNRDTLELWGWEAKGHGPDSREAGFLPDAVTFVSTSGLKKIQLTRDRDVVIDAELAGKWLLLTGGDTNSLIVLEQAPESVVWKPNPQGYMSLVVSVPKAPARAIILSVPSQTVMDENTCKFWAEALQKYPVSASECVSQDPAEGDRRQWCRLRYNYLDLTGGDTTGSAEMAPLPMLASFALKHNFPGLVAPNVIRTDYSSPHACYMLKKDSDTLTYQIPILDRSKVMKGVGELFARSQARDNIHGGLGERQMFQRMASWGFDHCRYALAFDADWDLPLVSFRGGPISEDEQLWKRLDELIANCNAAGMQMMLCSFTEIRSRQWKAHPEWQERIFEFWRRIAQRYADLPAWAISYDFFNEPAYMNTDHYNQIIQELTRIIRSVDTRHTIVWEPGDGWAQPQWCLWMEPADDANVLYSFHHYGKHWGYAYDEYYPGYQATVERTQVDHWLEAILFGIKHHVPIHCGEFGLSMIQPGSDGQAWLNDYLALFERFGIGWNWWNYSGMNIYRTGLAMGDRPSPYVPILRKWMDTSGWGKSRRAKQHASDAQPKAE